MVVCIHSSTSLIAAYDFNSDISSFLLTSPLISLKRIGIGCKCYNLNRFADELESVEIGWNSFILNEHTEKGSSC